MDNLSNKIKVYLGRTPDCETEVLLQDDYTDGVSNPYIKEWNAKDKSKPSDSELNSFSTEATKLKNNNTIRQTRKNAYGLIGDQLDLLYKDMVAGKLNSTGEWFKKIKGVKDANPKE